MLSELREFLLPQLPERDEGFRREIVRLATRSLYIMGGVNLGLPLVALPIGLFVAHQMAPPPPSAATVRLLSLGAFFFVGGSTIALAGTAWAGRYPRLIAGLSGLCTAAILILLPLLTSPDAIHGQAAVETGISLMFVQLVVVAVIPLRPIQMFAFGLSVMTLYLSSAAWISGWAATKQAIDQNHAVHSLPLTIILCATLCAVNYQRLFATYRSHQQTLQAQSRLFLAESAASMGRLTAALSHDLNTPVGALRSAVSSLASVSRQKSSASEERRHKLETAEPELHRVALDSANRIHETVQRMQRLTNLDRAEIMPVDLNELLEDVGSTIQTEAQDPVRLSTEFQPLPKLTLRPQQIGSALSHLLHYAVERARPDGSVFVTTRASDTAVEIGIKLSANGGMADPPPNLFDPAFEVQDRRVAAGNWELFNSRRLIREHHGDIRTERLSGGDLRFLITLPITPLG